MSGVIAKKVIYYLLKAGGKSTIPELSKLTGLTERQTINSLWYIKRRALIKFDVEPVRRTKTGIFTNGRRTTVSFRPTEMVRVYKLIKQLQEEEEGFEDIQP